MNLLNAVNFCHVLRKRIEEKGDTVPDYYQTFHDKYLKQNEYAKEFFSQSGIHSSEELIRAAQLFVLSNPKAHTTCIDFSNLTDVERFLSLSGQKLETAQSKFLDHYLERFGYLNCRLGCNLCEKACPNNIPVNTIMRYNYYFQVKGDEKRAMQLYGKLPATRPDACFTCPGYCEEACPFGVAAKGLLAVAHDNLSPLMS